jgi:DnaJ family protein A protein 2
MSNYYEILEINVTATSEEIKQSYRRLAIKHHPDKGGDKDIFQKIQTSYETLSDDSKRQSYDMSLNMNKFHAIPPTFNNGHVFPFNIFHFINETNLNKIHKKADEIFECNITLHEVYTGCTKNFHIKRKSKCDNCCIKCFSCDGKGLKNNNQKIQIGSFLHINNFMCGDCYGNGILRKLECSFCNNSGISYKEKHIDLLIPKGVQDNRQFIFDGWGEQSLKENEISGNLIIKIKILKDEIFERRNLDLYYQSDITVKECIIGKTLLIPYFNDPFSIETKDIEVIIPNKEYVILGKGLEDEYGNKGMLIIKFNVKYKEIKLTEEQIENIQKVLEGIEL